MTHYEPIRAIPLTRLQRDLAAVSTAWSDAADTAALTPGDTRSFAFTEVASEINAALEHLYTASRRLKETK